MDWFWNEYTLALVIALGIGWTAAFIAVVKRAAEAYAAEARPPRTYTTEEPQSHEEDWL